MMRPSPDDPIWCWIDAQVNGTINDADAARLADRLTGDEEARRLYLDYCELHGTLLFEVRSTAALQQAAQHVKNGGAAVCQPRQSETIQSRRAIGWMSWAAAASIILALGVAWVAWRSGNVGSISDSPQSPIAGVRPDTGSVSNPGEGLAERQPALVAVVSGLLDCGWSAGCPPLESGESVAEGDTIAVEQGLLQLTLERGTELVVQGPARLVLESDNSCHLVSGSIAARVPAHASGFVLRTSTAEVVDLGTAFGARVLPDGQFDLHVFDGEVVLWQQDGGEDEVHVLAGNSVSLTPDSSTIEYGVAFPKQFARAVVPKIDEAELPKLPVRQQLALWLAADVLVTTDNLNRVVAWRDILTGDNQTNEDAWQHIGEARPSLVSSGIGGKPAVRFDGQADFLETTPLLSTHDQTLFFVFSRASDFQQPQSHGESIRSARQLINYNGPVHDPKKRRYEDHEKHALQIGDRLAPGVYWGRVWATLQTGRPGAHLGSVLAARRIRVDEPIVLTYAYHPSRDQGTLFINGKLQGVDTAPLAREFTSRKVIGRSAAYPAFFHGDMSEVLIYNGALDGGQIASVCSYLGNKYAIEVAGTPVELVDRRPEQLKSNGRRDNGVAAHVRGRDPSRITQELVEVEEN